MRTRRTNSLPRMIVHVIQIYARRHPMLATILGVGAIGCVGALCIALQSGCPVQVNADHAMQSPALAPVAVEDCSDPVEGTWVGYQYLSGHKYRFDLDISRHRDELQGKIRSEYWYADLEDGASAPTCAAGGSQSTVVEMNADGYIRGDRVSFHGLDWEQTGYPCDTQSRTGYYPDRFTGHVIADNGELHVENDDGYNDATMLVFRRTSCEPVNTPATSNDVLLIAP